jgi:hypothetical protein
VRKRKKVSLFEGGEEGKSQKANLFGKVLMNEIMVEVLFGFDLESLSFHKERQYYNKSKRKDVNTQKTKETP